MAHSLLVTPSPSTASPISATSKNCKTHFQSLSFQTARAPEQNNVNRRGFAMGLVGVVGGLITGGGQSEAAARRPPPPPQEEKKDPNVSGLTAKVLASKKRKEAMKEYVAKQREQGKIINKPSE